MRQLCTRNTRGFTLIELFAVVIILAVLAGVALPKYFDFAGQAKESATTSALNEVRAAIATFSANEAINNGKPRFPKLKDLETVGEVMDKPIQPNPFRESNTVREAKWDEANPPVNLKAAGGWNYDPETGKFWANSNAAGEHRW